MSNFTLTIPEDVYDRARRIAEETAQPVEQILIEHLKHLPDSFSALPPDEQEELAALQHLSDDALWTIAAEQMPHEVQERMQILMDANSLGTITPKEYQELGGYVDRGNRLMERGHKFTQQDFRPKTSFFA
jgi:hypothetical protein